MTSLPVGVQRGVPAPPFKARPGYFIHSWQITSGGVANTPTLSNNAICFVPILVPQTDTFDRIGIATTVAPANTQCRLAIYRPRASDGYPGDLVIETSAVVLSSASGTWSILLPAPMVLEAGYYWIAIQVSATTRFYVVNAPSFLPFGATDLTPNTTLRGAPSAVFAFGPFPATAPECTTYTVVFPIVGLGVGP